MQRVGLVIFASIAFWIMSTTSGGAQPTTQDLIAGALQACHDGRIASDRATRAALYEKGQSLGEQAVAADEQSADAHFALFCNLGELMRIDGEMSLTSVFGFRRMMKELNRALELKPDHLDALSARGTLLVRLPSMLGGDPEKGEQVLRHVIHEVPEAVNARISSTNSSRGMAASPPDRGDRGFRGGAFSIPIAEPSYRPPRPPAPSPRPRTAARRPPGPA